MVMDNAEINFDLENVYEWSVVCQQKDWLEFIQVQHFPEHFLRKCGTGCKVGGMSRLALIVSRSVILED